MRPALAAIDAAAEDASAEARRLTGTIFLTVPRTAAEIVVLPIVAAFGRAHPGVIVELIVEDGFTDIVASRFDAGVRLGESLEQDMIAVPVGPPQRAAVVATPEYFTHHRIPLSPRDLAGHACIQRRFAGGALYRWEFEKGAERLDVAVEGPIVLNDDRLMAEAALAGAGLACISEAMVTTEVASGRLVRVLEDWCPAYAGFFLYYPNRRLMRPALRAFVDFAKVWRG